VLVEIATDSPISLPGGPGQAQDTTNRDGHSLFGRTNSGARSSGARYTKPPTAANSHGNGVRTGELEGPALSTHDSGETATTTEMAHQDGRCLSLFWFLGLRGGRRNGAKGKVVVRKVNVTENDPGNRVSDTCS
jgi:hypothetical protein